jgi:hypothetical protein
MINPDGAWYNQGQLFVDVIGALETAGGNKSQAARDLGVDRNTFYSLLVAQEAARQGKLPPVTNSKARGSKRNSWDTDRRVISFMRLEEQCSVRLSQSARGPVRDILQEAQALQLRGKLYPAPVNDEVLEQRYKRELRPIISDKNGKGILYPDEALLVVERYAHSEQRATHADDFAVLTEMHITRWMAGEARSRGTGNHEDSVFSRLGIVDPRTGEIAKFSWHAIRHWLDTVYANGGLSEDQLALIFGRKNRQQNATYDQTSSATRRERLKATVRDGMAIGRIADTYDRLADFSPDEAEEYLEAVARMVNPMPHGACMLDWASTPCPHHLSCFSCESEEPGPCEHLVVDPANPRQADEMVRIKRQAELSLAAIASQGGDESPQLDHFRRVLTNVEMTLSQIEGVKKREAK